MGIKAAERLVECASRPKYQPYKKKIAESALKILESLPDGKIDEKIALAYKLKEELRKEYPDVEALRIATKIDRFIRRIQPGVETIVIC
ncbi:MAG: hypothetical protein QXN37_00235 [Candidatus Anstonellaceae archaeon]